jgi:hypothetical protein
MSISLSDKPVANSSRIFLGRAWVNTCGEKSKTPGEKFINISLDNKVEVDEEETELIAALKTLKKYQIQLWGNKKREGKADADYRLSLSVAKA